MAETDGHQRYRELGFLGQGGMGTAWKVLDRLTGHEVCLKRPRARLRMRTDAGSVAIGTGVDDLASAPTLMRSSEDAEGSVFDSNGTEDTLDTGVRSGRLALAREFGVLAGLRHPGIVSVLDYGFDKSLEPFITMELIDGTNIVAAALDRARPDKVRLIVQMLEALAYLHHRGVLHRDIKPTNVMVAGDSVKLLDFGIATRTSEARAGEVAGTLGFIPPETFHGHQPSAASDLYSAGVIASLVLFDTPPTAVTEDSPLAHVVRQMAASDPLARPQSARIAATTLGEAAGLTQPAETVGVREAYLTATDLVGRAAELDSLVTAWHQAQRGRMTVRLVAGESGVGKSRLVAELRAQALVEGALVLRGHGRTAGSLPYNGWRDVAASLVLECEVPTDAAALLEAVVPNIQRLLGLTAPLGPIEEQSPEAARAALATVIGERLEAVGRPILLILEDMHWARPETIEVLRLLAYGRPGLPVFILATYRDDEAQLHETLLDFPTIRLSRLTEEGTAHLAESILGNASAELVSLIHRETEGNPFFIVEVMRAYAEAVGRLGDFAPEDLRSRIMPAGIRDLLARRLDRLGPELRNRLRLCALIGRELELDVLTALDPGCDWQAAFLRGSAAAVLSADGERWRFAHDKLREQLESEVADPVAAHAQIAAALRQVFNDDPGRAALLCWHYAAAGDTASEAHFAAIAGEHAVAIGASEQAITFLQRALDLLSASDTPRPRPRFLRWIAELFARDTVRPSEAHAYLGRLEGSLAEALAQTGKLEAAILHARRALEWLGQPMPKSTPGFVIGIIGQLILRGLQSMRPRWYRLRPGSSRPEYRAAVTGIQTRSTETFTYLQHVGGIFWSGLRTLNLGVPAGPSPDLARGYITMGIVVSIIPMRAMCRRLNDHAMAMARAVERPYEIGYCATRYAACCLQVADWPGVYEHLDVVDESAKRLRNPRMMRELHMIHGVADLHRGDYEAAEAHYAALETEAELHSDAQAGFWARGGQALMALRKGDLERAGGLVERVVEIDKNTMACDRLFSLAAGAEWALQTGDLARAVSLADRLLADMKEGPVMTYWSKAGLDAACQVYLDPRVIERYQTLDRAAAAVKISRGFGKLLLLAEAASLLWLGRLELVRGRSDKGRAHLTASLSAATEREQPWEAELARQALGPS